MEDIEIKKSIRRLINESRTSKCLHPNLKDCSGKVIRAHSIQNNKILNKISEEGMVISPIGEGSSIDKDFFKIGRRVATTFNGFCSKHDNNTFRAIEERDYSINNPEQEFLFAYRALCKEIISKENAKNMYLRVANNSPEMIFPLLAGTLKAIDELNVFKKDLDKSLLENDFSIIKTEVISFNKEFPIAVSSVFYPILDFEDNIVNNLGNFLIAPSLIFITLFPQKGKTYILLSYLKDDKEKFDFLKKQLVNLDLKEQKVRISSIICKYCENFVISPKKWREFDDEYKRKFIQEFKESMYGKDTKISNGNFNLFD